MLNNHRISMQSLWQLMQCQHFDACMLHNQAMIPIEVFTSGLSTSCQIVAQQVLYVQLHGSCMHMGDSQQEGKAYVIVPTIQLCFCCFEQ